MLRKREISYSLWEEKEHMHRQTDTEKEIYTHPHAHRRAHADRQTDRQTHIHTHTHEQIHKHTNLVLQYRQHTYRHYTTIIQNTTRSQE